MLLIIDGQVYVRQLTINHDRVVVSAAAFDNLPGSGHCVLIDNQERMRCFDYQMVWGNLKWTTEPEIYSTYRLRTKRIEERLRHAESNYYKRRRLQRSGN